MQLLLCHAPAGSGGQIKRTGDNQRSAPRVLAILFFDFREEIRAISPVIRVDLCPGTMPRQICHKTTVPNQSKTAATAESIREDLWKTRISADRVADAIKVSVHRFSLLLYPCH